jgi:hypothetical protein
MNYNKKRPIIIVIWGNVLEKRVIFNCRNSNQQKDRIQRGPPVHNKKSYKFDSQNNPTKLFSSYTFFCYGHFMTIVLFSYVTKYVRDFNKKQRTMNICRIDSKLNIIFSF